MSEIKEITEFLPPIRVVAAENADNPERLIGNVERQVPLCGTEFATVRPNGYILLDYGSEISGGARILTQIVRSDKYSAKIRVRFGESATEAMSELGEKNSGNHHSTRDFVLNVQNLSEVRFGSTGFRFIRIDNLDNSDIGFLSVQAAFTHSPLAATGSFSSDDEILDKIWEISDRTVFLNMQNGVLWDGVKRDRLVWAGDLYVEILSCLYIYGDAESVRNSIDMCLENVKKTGWANNIPSYSLWLALDIDLYYMYTGDVNYPKKCMPFIDDLLNRLDVCVDENGKFDPCRYSGSKTNRPYFIDWPTEGGEDNIYAVEAILRYTLGKIAKMKADSGESPEKAEEILGRAKKRPAKLTDKKSLNALQMLFGGVKNEAFAESLLKGGAEGISTFMAYFIFSAMFEAGYKKESSEILKEYFSAMINLGATTFFEDFDILWKSECFPLDSLGEAGKKDLHGDKGKHCYVGFRHSLCHGWASGAVPFIVEKIAGVKNLGEGFGKISVKPELAGLNRINMSVATPLGALKIKAENAGGKVKTIIEASKKTKIING